MIKAFKYRLYPTEEQQIILNQWFGCVRVVYNLALETKIEAWKRAQKNLTGFDLIKQMPDLKSSPEIPWLKECPADSLNLAILNVEKAYKGFFKGGGFPKFKNKHKRKSISFSRPLNVDFEGGTITVLKIKTPMLTIFHRTFEGKAKTTTISKTPTNEYYVSILVDDGEELPDKRKIVAKSTVGIDLGVKTFAILSEGTEYENPKILKNLARKLAIAQRTMTRRLKEGSKEQSKGYLEAKLQVAKINQHIANKRKDFQHNVSKEIVTRFNTIALEDLSVKQMTKSAKGTIENPGTEVKRKSGLNKAILDVGFSSFVTLLEYKAEWNGKNILFIDRYDPSSKMCNVCKVVNDDLVLSDREWDCHSCGTHHFRDINAAMNIKEIALNQYKKSTLSEQRSHAKVEL